MTDDAVVRAAKLTFAYGANTVLRDVDLELAAGQVFGVVGADGAGKSTLLLLLIGQLAPASGTVTVMGRPASDTALRQRMAYMPQGFGQYLDLSIGENLEFFAELHGLDAGESRSLIGDLLSRTGLAPFRDRRAGQLSGGMMQKLALACALVSRPKVMFLDEPTTGVDPVSRRAFWQLLDQVRSEGVAIVYATANMEEAERCDRVAMLVNGSFARQGSPLELIREVEPALFEVIGPGIRAKRNDVRAAPHVRLVFPVGETLKVWLDGARDEASFRLSVAKLAPQFEVRSLRPHLHDIALRDLALSAAASHGASGEPRR